MIRGVKNANFNVLSSSRRSFLILDFIENEKFDVDYIPQILYNSCLKTQPFEKEYPCFMDHFFKLDDKSVEAMYYYNIDDKESTGGSSREINKKNFFKISSNLHFIQYHSYNEKVELEHEAKKEVENLANKIESPILNKESAKLVSDDFYKKVSEALSTKTIDINIDQRYKRHLIAKAISNSVTKDNLQLESTYSVPDIKELSEFISYMYNKNKKKTTLLVLTLLLGLRIENILTLDYSSQVTFNKKTNSLLFTYLKSLFALPPQSSDFTDKTTSKAFIYLTDFMAYIYSFSLDYIKSYNKREQVFTELKKFVSEQKKSYKNTVTFSIKNLHTYSIRYYKCLHNSSIIDLLYTKDISKKEEAMVCYCTSSSRLIKYEKWVKRLTDEIDLKNIYKSYLDNNITQKYENNKWIGSNYNTAPGAFKNFILNLSKLYYQVDNIGKINIKMIYLRYTLGLLLATRNFHNSCELANYSKRFKILVIQEKAKSIYGAKRIIPLTKRALEYIEYFYRLKEENSLLSTQPVLVEIENTTRKEKQITKKSLLTYLDTVKNKLNHQTIEKINAFISNTSLNFGRHVMTTYMAHSEIDGIYIDAFLNHYSMGDEDQGIYSYMQNSEYIKSITEKISNLEREYFPSSIELLHE